MPSIAEERDTKICARFLEGITAVRLSFETGLSLPRIEQILKAGNVKDKPRAKQAEGDKVVSADHLLIGKKFTLFRLTKLGADRAFAAKKIGWSASKMSHVENGYYNLTLVDIRVIADFMQTTVSELLTKETT